ncbi:MAG: Crp/Fnr family transcriptional regulator [Bdellovibrionaceae bacterium]|nr:Crp/Fnr family transcriptional regulator [Pseudobdellovibrionaceae bacterium]
MRTQGLLCSSPNAVEVIEKSKVVTTYKTGQVVFYAGNAPLGIFTVQSGVIKLESVSSTGSAHTLRLVGPGGALGYRSMFAEEPYHASAIAVEDSVLCFVPKSDIMMIFNSSPQTALKLMTHISKDLRHAEEKWMDQMDRGASDRIAEALLFLQENFQHQAWTRRDIAQWAGTTPETVIRALAQFEKDGLISQKDGRQIHVLEKERLRHMLDLTK